MRQSLLVRVDEAQADAERLEALTLALRDELLETDVDDVSRPTRGVAPEGTRGLDMAMVGELLVAIPASAQAISSVIGAIRRWLSRGGAPDRNVTVTIGDNTLQLQSASPEQQERLIGEFLRATSSERAS